MYHIDELDIILDEIQGRCESVKSYFVNEDPDSSLRAAIDLVVLILWYSGLLKRIDEQELRETIYSAIRLKTNLIDIKRSDIPEELRKYLINDRIKESRFFDYFKELDNI
jgi:hypothetical protein